MRALYGFGIVCLSASALLAQYRGNSTPYMTGGFPSVVHPGGTSATYSGITRFQTNVVHPGGGGPQLHVPGSPGYYRGSRGATGGFIYSYGYPMYGGSYGGYYDNSSAPAPAQYVDPSAVPAQQPAVASPIIINIGVPGAPPPGAPAPPPAAYQQSMPPQEDTAAAEPTHYLIALKDHTIYSAVAYWVDGATLHYFTAGNVHNQVSVSLIDRELTDRLNKESGLQVNLPR